MISFEEGDPKLVFRRNIISVQEAGHEKSIDEMFSPRESESSLISTRIQQDQETSTQSDEMLGLFSDIGAFLNRPGSSLAAIETSPFHGSAQDPQSERSKGNKQQPITIAIAYTAVDEKYKNFIERDLKTLRKLRWNIKWHVYDIDTSMEWTTDVDNPLNTCNLLLLLVSPEFLSSDFFDDTLVYQAGEKHMIGAFWASPILLRPSLWEDIQNQISGRRLPVLPKDRRPVSRWPNEDDAFLEIAESIKRALEYLRDRI